MTKTGRRRRSSVDGRTTRHSGYAASQRVRKRIEEAFGWAKRSPGVFLLVLTIPAHVIWFLARGRDDGLPIAERYIPGIFDAIFWCAESMGGAAQAHPHRIFARAPPSYGSMPVSC